MSKDSGGTEAVSREPRRVIPSKAAMRRYILEHPELVLDDAELCAALVDLGAKRYGGNVISLQSAVMARMRQRLRAVEIEREEMIDAAETNLSSMSQVHDALLYMLEAQSFREFIEIVGSRFGELLAVDSIRLCVETTAGPRSKDAAPGLDILRPIEPGTVETLFGGAPWGVALREAQPQTAELHGSAEIESEALVRLDFGPDTRPGVLLFGSCDIDRFHEDQGGELLVFLGGAVSRVMRHWLDAPEGI